ncbi:MULTISPECIES: hypothetical protein [unclassified Achromobacter]|uniref:hypothetical protein n=1 Tax=unclassified Achromobacter TaxID=2626865 RepID=UPI000B51D77A|nr:MULTISPECIES: hypothetical protein [unclassified Achromobacter]OWT81106.1 hypothetical protein CEY05_03670 [Achromobacter sp. HZ34]OWT82607.1 hypothetical protein CEY04_03670 [Achromobacter sp. HZ28]
MDVDADANAGSPAATRLYAILAREARTAVIFRRGPTKQVQLIRWDLRTDTFEHGQWLKGRIYERRCDLSPSGRLLVYFAATNRPPIGSWTAISKPPFLTALALWPKTDSWGGGGIFEDENTLLLNHAPEHDAHGFEPAAGTRLKPGMQVKPCGPWSGRGEDDPINAVLRERAGWRDAEIGEGELGGLRATALYRYSKPRVIEKAGANGRRLQRVLHGVGVQQKPWYALDHRVLDREGTVLVSIPESDWADWDGGDLLFARGGCLYRLSKSRFKAYADQGDAAFQLLHDFSNARFTPMAPTSDALKY